MKNKEINAAVCDARDVTEESLKGFESVTVQAAVLILGERSRDLFNRYPVHIDAATIINVPDDISVRNENGQWEIGPETDGKGIFLIVNGKLTIENDALDAVNSFYKILVNGKTLMPLSYRGRIVNMEENGKTEYYPDGAKILKGDAVIDDLFVIRARNRLYYTPGTLYILDTGLDPDALLEKGLEFAAGKMVISESTLKKLAPILNEEAQLVRVPDGTRYIGDDLDLTMETIEKYGSRLCVYGDVTISDAEALSRLEYLYVDGDVNVEKRLEGAFRRVESVYEDLNTFSSDKGYIAENNSVTVGKEMLHRYPAGIVIKNCLKVKLSKELTQEDIFGKLSIIECPKVFCYKEQEEAVNMICREVPMIKIISDGKENGEELEDEIPGRSKDTIYINAAQYRM